MHTQKCGNIAKMHWITSSQWEPCGINLEMVNILKQYLIYITCLSADLTQRSRLFPCVETKSWSILSSVTASAVLSVNSGQSISGKSISVKELLSLFKAAHMFTIPTFQSQICFWWMLSIHDFWKINCLKCFISIIPCPVPFVCHFYITQVCIFLDYLAIKLGEYNHQWNCEYCHLSIKQILKHRPPKTHLFLSLCQKTVVLYPE